MDRARTVPPAYLKSYCLKGTGDMDGYFRIQPQLRQAVDFQWMNLMNPASWIKDLDVVFLRNVLIYFDAPTRQTLLARIIDGIESVAEAIRWLMKPGRRWRPMMRAGLAPIIWAAAA